MLRTKILEKISNIFHKDICNEIFDHYPAGDQMFSKKQLIDVIPQSLQLLLNEVIHKSSEKQNADNELDKKTTSIAHTIMSSVRHALLYHPVKSD